MPNEDWRGGLDRRRHALLMAVIDDFVRTAQPVASQQIVGKYALGVRGATVRSMMAELEHDNFLHQPHTSAGRVPTDKAFRYYVDHLEWPRRIGHQERARIEYHYTDRERDPGELVRDTAHLLSLLSGQMALALTPRFEAISLSAVRFVRLREAQVLAVFVAVDGRAHHRIVETARDYRTDELERMAGFLNECVGGRTLEEARSWIEAALREEQARYDRFVREALTLGGAVVKRPIPVDVYLDGSAKVVRQPEFDDPERVRAMLQELEDKSALLDLLERTLTGGAVEVSIGSEHAPHLADLSLVTAGYCRGTMAMGRLAIVGPVRMDYGRVIALVDYTARALSRALES